MKSFDNIKMDGMDVKIMELLCLFRTVSTPDDLVSMWKDTVSCFSD